MANTNNPFGFVPYGTVGGSTPNFRLSKRLIASTNSTAIFKGDVVVPVSGATTGYITQATATTTANCGVFWGCEYLSASQGNVVRNSYWPGSDANGDVTAYIYDAPDMLFTVQAGSTAIGLTNLNQNAQLVISGQTGSTITGISAMYLNSTTGTTSNYPFVVWGFVQDPTGVNGTDITTGYNWVIVGWNLEVFKAGVLQLT